MNEADMRRSLPIGVFDSGLGGLTVAREIMRNLPMEKIDDFNWKIRLMLTEEGHFEGKCFIFNSD